MFLSWRNRQQRGQSKASRTARPARPRKFRPLFETLENRVLLSVITINVTNPADVGGLPVSDGNNTFHGTLRQAINEANLATSSDGNSYLIKLQAATTYQIASGGGAPEDTNAVGGDFDLTSRDPVTIQGANGPSGGSIVDGNFRDRVFDVATGASNLITFDTLTIQHGQTTGDGGGLRTAPGTMVKLTNVIVQDNAATNDGGGIAAGYAGFSPSGGSGGSGGLANQGSVLANQGSLTIVGSQILNNFAENVGVTSHGGGIALRNETANISGQSLIRGNEAGASFSGGALFGEGGGLYTGAPSGGSNVTVDNSTISGNTAWGDALGVGSGRAGEGGGAWIGAGDTLTVQNGSTIGGPSGGQNTAAASSGTASDVFGGKGGGIYGDVGSTVNIGSATNANDNSTVSYNLAGGSKYSGGGGSGGGIYSDGIVKLNNSTVAHNTAGTFHSVSVSIKPLISTTGGGSGEGGGVFADGTSGGSFTSTNSHIDYNTAQGGTDDFGTGARGGGMALVNENATILGGTVSHNTAEGNHSFSGGGGGAGGGIFVARAFSGGTTLNIGASADGKTVNPVTIASNTAGGGSASFSGGGAGGGIFLNSGDILKLTNSTVHGNQALGGSSFSGGGGAGGGIFAIGQNNPSGGSVSIKYSTIDGNTAAAASGGGDIPVGGGLMLIDELASIFSSTISNNHADGGDGGGVFAVGLRNTGAFAAVKPNQVEHPNPNIMVTNTTIANNTANYGGGLYNTASSVVQLTNDTVAFNQVRSGGGGVDRASGTVIVWNTIIAKNTFPSGGRETDVLGSFLSLGHNLIGLTSGVSGGSNGFSAAKGDQFSTNSNAPLDPGLNPLANNGGPTLTCSLKVQPRSPAIDAGDDAALSVTGPYDQRGPGFPRKLGTHIDIGAFEARTSIRPGGDQ